MAYTKILWKWPHPANIMKVNGSSI